MHFRKIILCFFLVLTVIAPAQADNTASAVQQWLALRDSRQLYDFLTYARFLSAHPTWPSQNAIRLNAEGALLRDNADNGTITDWFSKHPPMTDEGRLRYVQALRNLGRTLQARQLAVEYWHDGYFDSGRQARLIAVMGGIFSTQDHAARADTLLWQGNMARAETVIPNLTPANRAVVKARMALQQSSSKAPQAVQDVPSQYRNQGGLLYDRVRYARRRDDDAFAAQLIGYATGSYGDHGAAWGKERLLLARRAFEHGNPQRAFAIARQVEGLPVVERAELHWFAGWMALTRLRQARQAQPFFETMYSEVATPLSKARAAYWAGAAASEAGDRANAQAWYQRAAQHPHVFYGLMAAYALGNPQTIMAQFVSRNQSVSSVPSSDLASAARILHRMNKTTERDLFVQALITEKSKTKQAHTVIPLAREFNSAKLALIAAKAAYLDGVLVVDALFPRMPFAPQAGIEPALTLAIARQESLFDPYAVSSAGARGLLQLMPGTAAHVAKRYGIGYRDTSTLFQPRTNLQLGQFYLKDLQERYDGFAPLSIAAYNAGPGNVTKFIASNGDPRTSGADWTDWVERIPFYETRNYVQRVWEAYVVYGYILSPDKR